MQLFVYFSSFSIKIAPCYGILGNNLLGMLKCLSLKYYPGRDTETLRQARIGSECVIDFTDDAETAFTIRARTSGQQIVRPWTIAQYRGQRYSFTLHTPI